MPRCTRCGTELESSGGLLARFGLAALDGYECNKCGTLICSDCYRERRVELAGRSHDRCPNCESSLVKR